MNEGEHVFHLSTNLADRFSNSIVSNIGNNWTKWECENTCIAACQSKHTWNDQQPSYTKI